MPTDITAAAAVQVSAVGTGLPANGGYWNAETAPPAWIEFTWPHLVTIDQVVLTVEQSPNGNTSHRIVATLVTFRRKNRRPSPFGSAPRSPGLCKTVQISVPKHF